MDLELIFNTILSNFNFGLILSINALTFGLIKICDMLNKTNTSKTIKILITIISSLLFGIVYYKISKIDLEVIINSCVSAPLIWDWILKPIFKKIKLDYEV